jgi:hypothetical protein
VANKDLEDIPRKTRITSFLGMLSANARTEKALEPKHPRKQMGKKSQIQLQVMKMRTQTKKWNQAHLVTAKQMANK